jgi:hypothetical protein
MFCTTRGQSSPRLSAFFSVLTLTLSLSFVSCFGKTDELDHFRIQIGKTVKITASYNYCWYPTVHRFPTGEILATMRMSPDDTNPEGEFSAYCLSKDGGQTWSRRYTMGAGANIDAAYSQVPLENGIWVLGAGYFSLEPSPSGPTDFHDTLTEFSRAGMNVQQIRDASIHLSEPPQLEPVETYATKTMDASQLASVPAAVPVGAMIAGPRGEWLSTLYYTPKRDRRYIRLVLIRSFDHGHTWNEDGIIAAVQPDEKPWPWMGSEGPNEAGLVRLSDGRLFCIFRTGSYDSYMGGTWSSDDGKTWSPPISTGFKGVAPHLRLMSKGLLVCTFGRPGVTIMFSQNEGKSWAAVTPVFKGQGSGYSDVIEVGASKLLVVYDSLPEGGNPVSNGGKLSEHAIYGTFVEVQKR